MKETAKSRDMLLRRAIVRGFSGNVDSKLLPAMALYLEDPDLRTRDEALRHLVGAVPTSKILDFLASGREDICRYLLSHYSRSLDTTGPRHPQSGSWYWRYQEALEPANEDRLLDLYRRWHSGRVPSFVRDGNATLFSDSLLWQHLLSRPQGWATLALVVGKTTDSQLIPSPQMWTPETAPSPAQILKLAQSLPPCSSDVARADTQRDFVRQR